MEGERENKVGKKERGTEKWEIRRREGKGWKLTITEYLYINGKPPRGGVLLSSLKGQRLRLGFRHDVNEVLPWMRADWYWRCLQPGPDP